MLAGRLLRPPLSPRRLRLLLRRRRLLLLGTLQIQALPPRRRRRQQARAKRDGPLVPRRRLVPPVLLHVLLVLAVLVEDPVAKLLLAAAARRRLTRARRFDVGDGGHGHGPVRRVAQRHAVPGFVVVVGQGAANRRAAGFGVRVVRAHDRRWRCGVLFLAGEPPPPLLLLVVVRRVGTRDLHRSVSCLFDCVEIRTFVKRTVQ